MKFYLTALINSVYNITWLRAQKNNVKQAANYFVLFIFLFSAVVAGFFTYTVTRHASVFLSEFRDNVPAIEVSVYNSELSVTGIDQPYRQTFYDEGQAFVVMVDTVSTSTMNPTEGIDIKNVETPTTLLVTRDFITLYNADDHKVQTQYMTDISENFSVTSEQVISRIDRLLQQWHVIFLILWVVLFIAIGIGKLIHIAMIVTLAYIYSNIRKINDWNFKQMYTVGLFAITLPTLLNAVLVLIPVHIPFLSTVLTLVFVGMVITMTEKNNITKE